MGRRRRRRSHRWGREGEAPEDEEPDPARQDAPRRWGREQALHGARHRRRVPLQQLRHDRHEYHLSSRWRWVWILSPLYSLRCLLRVYVVGFTLGSVLFRRFPSRSMRLRSAPSVPGKNRTLIMASLSGFISGGVTWPSGMGTVRPAAEDLCPSGKNVCFLAGAE